MRTRKNMDFSKCELTIHRDEYVTIHKLHKDTSPTFNIDFINTNGVCVITGTCGEWVLSDNLLPKPGSRICDDYWAKKLSSHETGQEAYEFSKQFTKDAIVEDIKSVNHSYEEEDYRTVMDYFVGCLECLEESQLEYEHFAINELPDCMECESIVIARSIKKDVLYIFDVFEEICRRLKEQEVVA